MGHAPSVLDGAVNYASQEIKMALTPEQIAVLEKVRLCPQCKNFTTAYPVVSGRTCRKFPGIGVTAIYARRCAQFDPSDSMTLTNEELAYLQNTGPFPEESDLPRENDNAVLINYVYFGM